MTGPGITRSTDGVEIAYTVHRIGEPNETARCMTLAEQVTREGEERDCGQERQIRDAQYLERDVHEIGVVALEAQHCACRDHGEQRRTEYRQQDENEREYDHRGALFPIPVAIRNTSRMTETRKR
jgi:hypothetical protein